MTSITFIFSWLFYLIALVLKIYANQIKFMSLTDMPFAFSHKPRFATNFWLTRLFITYGALIGIWFVHGWGVLASAFLLYLLVSIISFMKGSSRSIRKYARLDFDNKKADANDRSDKFDENAMLAEAFIRAKRIVEENLRHNGNL